MTLDLLLRLLGAFSGGFAIASLWWNYQYRKLVNESKKRYDEIQRAILEKDMNLGAFRFAIRTGMLVKAEEKKEEQEP